MENEAETKQKASVRNVPAFQEGCASMYHEKAHGWYDYLKMKLRQSKAPVRKCA